MHILIVSQYFWPENFRLNELATELVSRGHEVTVLTGTPNYPDGDVFPEFKKDPARFSQYAGVSIVRLPFVPRGQSKIQLILNYMSFVLLGLTLGAWRLRGKKFDAIFAYLISPITAALPALFLGKLKRAPVFIWVLDLWPETLSAVGVVRSPWILGLVGRLVAFIYRHSDRVLIQSKGFASNVSRYGCEAARVRYFPGWAEQVFEGQASDSEVAPELEAYRDGFNILFAGNIGDAQDFPAILDAADILRHRSDVRWIVVGDGRASPKVVAEIEKRNLHDKVVMLGRFPVERMPFFLRGRTPCWSRCVRILFSVLRFRRRCRAIWVRGSQFLVCSMERARA
ncbi:glycosyltransferase family 4 protein [Afipia sp. P52-10]|uniref:glycosyltransferase family 4 protein n=1 Tax=Afipia sp. P52-10 TaxID=1429916 RepID=UPI0019D409EA|nr:glycosyltransferase family 4 protein [Afipia sp. P52-10]